MATFNAAEGTGGMDGSIRLERDRPEVGPTLILHAFQLFIVVNFV